jgi:CHAT domain-containing protein/Tfp pilus assembly protein PilF
MFYHRLTGLTLALLAILFVAGAATAAQDRALKPGESIEIGLRAGQSQNFKLALSPLDYARLSVNPRNQEITVKIIAPGGKEVVARDLSRDSGGAATVSFVAGYWGDFRLEITSREKDGAGEKVEINFAELRTVAPRDAERIAAERAFAEGEQFRARESNEERRPAIAKYQEALRLWQTTGDRAGQASALNALGRVYDNLNDRDKAFASFTEALEIRRELKDRAGEAASLNGIANIYNTRGERRKAFETFQQVLQIRRELKDRRGEGAALHSVASVHQALNERDQALKNYGEALKLRDETGDQRGKAATLMQLGVLARQMGNYPQALDYYRQSLEIFQAIDDKRGEAATINSLGALFLFQGKRKEALPYLERAYEIQRALGLRRQEAVSLYNIGLAYSDLGDQQKALDYLHRSLQLQREVKDQAVEAATLQMIGTVYSELGEKRRALDYFNQARPLLRSTGGPAQESLAIYAIGGIYNAFGDSLRALDYYQQALSHWRAAKDPALQAAALNSIGLLYSSLGERKFAIEYFNQSLELRRKLGNPFEEAMVLNNLGVAFIALGEKEKALEYFNRALELAKDNRRITANTLNATTLIYNERGEHMKTLDNLNRALAFTREIGDRPAEAETLHNLGWTHYDLKQSAQARDYLNQSLEIYRGIGDRSGQAGTLYALALVEFNEGDLEAARSRIEAALEIAESLHSKLGSQELRASYFVSEQSHYGLYIQVLMKMHERQPDRGLDGEALQASERARVRGLLEILAEVNADIREGVDASLIERERALQQRLSGKADVMARLFTSPSTPERAEKVEALKKEIDALSAEYRQVRAEIRRASPRYTALTQPSPLSLKEIQQQALDDNTLLLEYSLGKERSFLWAVTTKKISSFVLPPRKEIETAARQVYELLSKPNQAYRQTAPQRRLKHKKSDAEVETAEAIEAFYALSDMLLKPVASQLSNKRLVIVAEGALQYLPFSALPKPLVASPRSMASRRARSRRPAGVGFRPPLVVDHEVISLPSASTLAVLRRETADRPPAPKTLAVIADPVFEKDDERVKTVSIAPGAQSAERKEAATAPTVAEERLIKHLKKSSDQPGVMRIARLPFTAQEANQIASLVSESERKQAMDFAANRATAMASDLAQYRFVHFATHGYLDSERPELSALVLSLVDEKGAPQSGFLYAHEVYNLKLPAEVIVLSACETGLGKEIRGEGLVGLTRGFMYAGAPRVVVSLWSVNDKATAELMGKFYRKMLVERERPASALRAAQVEMWKQQQWQAPYYWAAFVLQGEWR